MSKMADRRFYYKVLREFFKQNGPFGSPRMVGRSLVRATASNGKTVTVPQYIYYEDWGKNFRGQMQRALRKHR